MHSEHTHFDIPEGDHSFSGKNSSILDQELKLVVMMQLSPDNLMLYKIYNLTKVK
jgi:hypothetical protein